MQAYHATLDGMQPGQPKSNLGLLAGVLGGIAAVGGAVAVAYAGSKKSPPKLAGVRRTVKKPCGCGR